MKVGDVAAFERPFLDLGKRLVAKSMDDRIGCAVLIETLRQLEDLARTSCISSSPPRKKSARAAPPPPPSGSTRRSACRWM